MTINWTPLALLYLRHAIEFVQFLHHHPVFVWLPNFIVQPESNSSYEHFWIFHDMNV